MASPGAYYVYGAVSVTDDMAVTKLYRSVSEDAEITSKRFSLDQSAVIDLAKQAGKKKGISRQEADILWNWAQEYGLTGTKYHGPQFDSYQGGNQLHMKINGMHINILDKEIKQWILSQME